MTRFLAGILLTALAADAGTIQGVVLEHSTGRPLARSTVMLTPVPTPGTDPATSKSLNARTARAGQFVFPTVAPGMYILTAAREGFFTAGFGQRLPASRGTPITVTADSSMFAEMRLRHHGAVTGRVLDENGVGTPGVPVVAYRARLPLRTVGAAAISDDRGVYRIHGLMPGKYWVRTGGIGLPDGSAWGATFGPQGREPRDARMHAVTVDADTAYADISPEPGAAFRLGGEFSCPGGYRFEGLTAGLHEVFVTGGNGKTSGFLELNLQRDHLDAHVPLQPNPDVTVEVVQAGGRQRLRNLRVKLTGRRMDLSEAAAPVDIPLGSTTLAPGYWELLATPPEGYYVESIATGRLGRGTRANRGERTSEWHEVRIDPLGFSFIGIAVSNRAAEIGGRVLSESKPMPGVPVFLWPVQEAVRKSLGGFRQTLTDTEGRFLFANLPPEEYRAVASYDLNEMDHDTAEATNAVKVKAEPQKPAQLDLTLWVAP